MLSLLLPLVLAADPGPASARWEYHDRTTFAGRSVLTYRPVELVGEPVRPLSREDRPPGKARYGLLPVGNRPDDYPSLVWAPDAPGGPQVWIDADGDGRFAASERHRLDGTPLEVEVRVTYGGDPARRLPRTIVLRRSATGDGLRYAVRGYVSGRLDLGGQVYDALLTDHNADGCFDKPGEDRVWIDLNRDGVFDPLTEQFPLGTPLTVASRTYLIQSSADGETVRVRERPTARGSLRLELRVKPGIKVGAVALQLVSDWGELASVDQVGQPVALPAGRYAVEALTCQLTDSRGRVWSYRLVGERRFNLNVQPGRETTARPLEGLALHARPGAPAAGVAPGQDLAVSPTLRTPAGLEVVNAEYVEAGGGEPVGATADIRLIAADGALADQTSSGFQ